ncbi:MAG TPA: sigma-70 family RNA polymerase sigma factor [Verrucomicrobiae bacterium]|nr:sigma-70 family RNA polymerase sigma factor [Verrucomicrobiae bacterium]
MERVTHLDAGAAASDQELVERYRAGDESAFDDLVLRHQQRAFNVAYQLLRNPEDATEVAQDAFVRMYRRLNGFRGDCEFTTWLHQIVVNLARNRYRWWKRRGKDRGVSLDHSLETESGDRPVQMAAGDDPPDVQAVNAEFVELVSRRMNELPRRFREVLVLRNVESLSYEQIATVLDCSVGTVKSRLARAREQLRKAMEEL